MTITDQFPEHTTGPTELRCDNRKTELPFIVRVVRNNEQLRRATQLRGTAYSKHTTALGEALYTPEAVDRDPDSIIFIAESKTDSETLGTIRIQTNFKSKLMLEESIKLPPRFANAPSAGVSRLAVRSGPRGKPVKLALFKAMHRYCLAKQVEWALIGARPPLDRDYEKLEFIDVFDDGTPRPLQSAKGIPHRILAFNVTTAERRWYASNHPLYEYMFRTWHPDLQVFASVSNPWGGPNRPQDQAHTPPPPPLNSTPSS